jgi:hypothetical protein
MTLHNTLLPLDSSGKLIESGTSVLIPSIPDWLIHDLPAEDVLALQRIEGTVMKVMEIDKFGYLWFGLSDQNPWFCLRPDEVSKVEPVL